MSQHEQILKMLRKAGNRGVPNYKFPEHRILRYGARIGELREDGHNITAVHEKLPNGRSTGVWRYFLNEEE